MVINFSERQEQCLKLVGQGLTTHQIALQMRVKKGTIDGGYIPTILDKTGLTTREELVLYAKQNGYSSADEPVGTDIERLCRVLRGIQMEPVRDFYRRLELHYLCNHCDGCKSYHQYGVMVVNGNLEYHLEQFIPPDKDVRVFLFHLKQKDLIEMQNNAGVHRITFKYFAPQEEAC